MRKIDVCLHIEGKMVSRFHNEEICFSYNDEQAKIIACLEVLKDELTKNNKKEKSSEPISAREKNILKHIALGLTNKEIADQLFISIHTVVTHRKNITHKLGIKSVSGLTVYAILNNLIAMDEVK